MCEILCGLKWCTSKPAWTHLFSVLFSLECVLNMVNCTFFAHHRQLFFRAWEAAALQGWNFLFKIVKSLDLVSNLSSVLLFPYFPRWRKKKTLLTLPLPSVSVNHGNRSRLTQLSQLLSRWKNYTFQWNFLSISISITSEVFKEAFAAKRMWI